MKKISTLTIFISLFIVFYCCSTSLSRQLPNKEGKSDIQEGMQKLNASVKDLKLAFEYLNDIKKNIHNTTLDRVKDNIRLSKNLIERSEKNIIKSKVFLHRGKNNFVKNNKLMESKILTFKNDTDKFWLLTEEIINNNDILSDIEKKKGYGVVDEMKSDVINMKNSSKIIAKNAEIFVQNNKIIEMELSDFGYKIDKIDGRIKKAGVLIRKAEDIIKKYEKDNKGKVNISNHFIIDFFLHCI